ncbi:OLC1v1034685C1 [Oldenlandia corymbosa var. corymbosa]|uniref:OLC1v1034685C1 n=1 Tax=Oldenlandia corymbosa var. corymbosa TaxID=529605 RepID=A0AAV1CU09_OLDCO|nr:OLC1v1034685C1 [Oldenlandia corymbosa var. corymbosa]
MINEFQKILMRHLCVMKMEIKEAEKVVIAKPVASRPACSSFRSFSDLLTNAESSETAITAAIRPRTMRVKAEGKHHTVGAVSSQAEISKAAACASVDKVFKPERIRKPNVVYKPVAKPVSRTTIPALTNAESELEDLQHQNLVYHQADLRSELHHKLPSAEECEHSKMSSEIIMEEDHKSSSNNVPSFGDRPSYDGYSWRKYGQKQVKGSETPRSYYKCSHPNCPVKKKIERLINGQISEIVYKGEHNHPKPRLVKHNSSDEQLQGNMGKIDLKQPPWYNKQSKNEHHEGKGTAQSQYIFGLSSPSSFSGSIEPILDQAGSTISFGAAPLYSTSYHGGEFAEATNKLEPENGELMSKRRKYNGKSKEPGASVEGGKEATIVQNATDSTIVNDGFRWRKYGQKVVKGNPYPRSYYRCTTLKCNVRKYVERTSDEPNAFITTYEGKHNHEMPIKNTNYAANKTNTKAAVGS